MSATFPYASSLCFIHGRHINGRLDAVSELAGDLSPEADASRALLKKLPDVERLLSRVHSMASKHRSNEHPESRAIMYEDTKYSIRKVLCQRCCVLHRSQIISLFCLRALVSPTSCELYCFYFFMIADESVPGVGQ